MGKISVLHVKVGEEPEVVTVDNTLEQMQNLVGGFIEVVGVAQDILMIVNEEGKLKNLPDNFGMHRVKAEGNVYSDELLDVIHGDVAFVAPLGPNFTSLDKIQVKEIKGAFKNRKRFEI